ncbi:MAG: hypothetical protein R3315_01105 [Woeseiaceae bacterium]|nr:hypothetical protein [Woeseiaceae bacterium]
MIPQSLHRHLPTAAGNALLVLAASLAAGLALAGHHTLAERIASDSRSETDRARDAGRKPAEVLEFLGVEAGMDVIDVMAAGGWYTEVLAHAVGEDGSVAAQNPDWILAFRDGANDKALAARLEGDRLPNVYRLDKNFDELGAGDGPFDVALSALNFHDVYNRDGRDAAVAMLESIRGILEPGGVFGIIDHAGDAGADNAALHRIEKNKVIEAARAAGFVVEAESDVLSAASDDRTQMVFADGLRGQTDRFVIRLRKPEA